MYALPCGAHLYIVLYIHMYIYMYVAPVSMGLEKGEFSAPLLAIRQDCKL